MQLFNAPNEVANLLGSTFLNESFSQVNIETVNEINPKLSFCAFLNDEQQFVQIAKNLAQLNSKIILFDTCPKLLIHLIETGINPELLLLVGIQDCSSGEHAFLRQHFIKFYSMRELTIEGIADVCDAVMSVAKDSARVHVHVNETVLNTTGILPRDLLYFFQRLRLLKSAKSSSLKTAACDAYLQAKLAVELF